MQSPPIWIWIVWAASTALLLTLLAYQGTLTRYEDDSLYLDNNSEQHAENDAVLHKVARLKPLLRICVGATCVLSATIIGIYVWEAIRQFYT